MLIFVILYLINLVAFALIAEAAFRELNAYNTKKAAFVTLFYSSFGTFDFEEIE
jgi:hypothetical protein